MIAISAVVGSTVLFDGELWVGGVAGVGDVDGDEASDRKFGGVVSLSRTDIYWKWIVWGVGVSMPLLSRT